MNIAVARKQLTEEEMEEVEARIAQLQSEIEEDRTNDENVDDQFEIMIQTTLTVSRYLFVRYGWLKNSTTVL